MMRMLTWGADLEATAEAGPVVSISHCRVSDYNGTCILALRRGICGVGVCKVEN